MDEERLRQLIDAGLALNAELSVEAAERTLREQAALLTRARRATIDPTPRAGEASLTVPIVVRGAAYRHLNLEGELATDAEDVATLLAAQAAVAIENARLYESATRWLHHLEALTEVGNALANERELPHLLQLIVERLRELIGARLVLVELPTGDDEFEIKAADGDAAEDLIGFRIPRKGSKSGRVYERRRSERVDSLMDDVEVYQPTARHVVARAGLFVPMLVREEVIGMIVAVNKADVDDRFTDDDLHLAEAFASRAAVAVDLSSRLDRAPSGSAVEPAPPREGLTRREAEVLRLVAMGLSDAKVAARLVVSDRTVHAHLRSIYRKLGVTSRAAATRYALEHGLTA